METSSDDLTQSAKTSHPNFPIIKRSDRSIILRLLQRCIKPFGVRLTNPPKKPLKDFSPEITFPSSVQTTTRIIAGIRIYDLTKKATAAEKAASQTTRIYYFAGGGWQSTPSSHHLKFCRRIVKELPSDTVLSVVSYPLAPIHSAPKAFPALLELYKTVLNQNNEPGVKVVLAGDSAGANVVLALTLEALRLDSEAPVPSSLLLISPAVELAHMNPDLAKMGQRRLDPLLRLRVIKEFGKAWGGEWDCKSDTRLSPLLAENLDDLRRRDVRVHFIVGTYDLLTPDALIFRDKLVDIGVKGSCLEWEGLMHCWMIMAGFGNFSTELKVGWETLLKIFTEK